MKDTHRLQVLKICDRQTQHIEDEVVVEEPLEIRVNGDSFGVTMRTPGGDFDLAVGLLRTEGIIRSAGEIGTMAYCANEEDPNLQNIVNVTLVDSSRHFESNRARWSSSSCGLCGKATIEDVCQFVQPIQSKLRIEYGRLLELPARLRVEQTNFDRTGGIHAAGLFDVSGNAILIREDLGRHNAVDKVLGAAMRTGAAAGELVMMVSGRLGFEIAQKALMAGVPILASVSAPSSLAIELANELGMTAVGFVRGRSMNIYTHPERILNGISEHSA